MYIHTAHIFYNMRGIFHSYDVATTSIYPSSSLVVVYSNRIVKICFAQHIISLCNNNMYQKKQQQKHQLNSIYKPEEEWRGKYVQTTPSTHTCFISGAYSPPLLCEVLATGPRTVVLRSSQNDVASQHQHIYTIL